MQVNFNEHKDIWNNFVSESPQRSIFVHSNFLDSMNTSYNLITCYEKDNIVAGAVVLFSENNEPVNSVFPFTQYQGLLLSDNSHLKIHSQISNEFKVLEFFISELANKYNNLCLCQSWQFSDMRPFQWHNYHEPKKGRFNIDLRYTGILDLTKYSSFDDYLISIRSVRRQEYKKSLKNLEFKWISDENILDELHDKTFKRQGINRDLNEAALVKSITKKALIHGYGKLCCAYYEDKPVSSILFLYDNKTAYYLFGANDPEYRNAFSGNFLMLNLIKDCFEKKMLEIDFVGVNSPQRGDYKLSYNAELKNYFIVKLNSIK